MTRTLALLLILSSFPGVTAAEPAADSARAAFERFKGLEGKWRGKSTRGWEEESTFRTIAGGSAVLSTSFDAHPNETMATVFSLDGEHLQLVHYCVAKNAPRLRATKIEDGGRTVHFTFVDGGNLPDRDQGHMDRAVYRFRDDGTVTSQWTWYEKGKERWMEEIVSTRLPAAASR
jgi:hypothetical protein